MMPMASTGATPVFTRCSPGVHTGPACLQNVHVYFGRKIVETLLHFCVKQVYNFAMGLVKTPVGTQEERR